MAALQPLDLYDYALAQGTVVNRDDYTFDDGSVVPSETRECAVGDLQVRYYRLGEPGALNTEAVVTVLQTGESVYEAVYGDFAEGRPQDYAVGLSDLSDAQSELLQQAIVLQAAQQTPAPQIQFFASIQDSYVNRYGQDAALVASVVALAHRGELFDTDTTDNALVESSFYRVPNSTLLVNQVDTNDQYGDSRTFTVLDGDEPLFELDSGTVVFNNLTLSQVETLQTAQREGANPLLVNELYFQADLAQGLTNDGQAQTRTILSQGDAITPAMVTALNDLMAAEEDRRREDQAERGLAGAVRYPRFTERELNRYLSTETIARQLRVQSPVVEAQAVQADNFQQEPPLNEPTGMDYEQLQAAVQAVANQELYAMDERVRNSFHTVENVQTLAALGEAGPVFYREVGGGLPDVKLQIFTYEVPHSTLSVNRLTEDQKPDTLLVRDGQTSVFALNLGEYNARVNDLTYAHQSALQSNALTQQALVSAVEAQVEAQAAVQLTNIDQGRPQVEAQTPPVAGYESDSRTQTQEGSVMATRTSKKAKAQTAQVETAAVETPVSEATVAEAAVVEPEVVEPEVAAPAVVEPTVAEPTVVEAAVEPAVPVVVEPEVVAPPIEPQAPAQPQTEIDLRDLMSERSLGIIATGKVPQKRVEVDGKPQLVDRTPEEGLAMVTRAAYGAENFCKENGLPIALEAEALIENAAREIIHQNGLASLDHLPVDREKCRPVMEVATGNQDGVWARIEEKYPEYADKVPEAIQAERAVEAAAVAPAKKVIADVTKRAVPLPVPKAKEAQAQQPTQFEMAVTVAAYSLKKEGVDRIGDRPGEEKKTLIFNKSKDGNISVINKETNVMVASRNAVTGQVIPGTLPPGQDYTNAYAAVLKNQTEKYAATAKAATPKAKAKAGDGR